MAEDERLHVAVELLAIGSMVFAVHFEVRSTDGVSYLHVAGRATTSDGVHWLRFSHWTLLWLVVNCCR